MDSCLKIGLFSGYILEFQTQSLKHTGIWGRVWDRNPYVKMHFNYWNHTAKWGRFSWKRDRLQVHPTRRSPVLRSYVKTDLILWLLSQARVFPMRNARQNKALSYFEVFLMKVRWVYKHKNRMYPPKVPFAGNSA